MNVEGIIGTSGGTIKGLSLNFATWIRDDWRLPPAVSTDKSRGQLVKVRRIDVTIRCMVHE